MRYIITTTMQPDREIEVDERERDQLDRDGVLNSAKPVEEARASTKGADPRKGA